MKDFKEIISTIKNKDELIIKKFNRESVEVYLFIKNQFDNTEVSNNYLFQFIYRSFYRLDGVGISTEWKRKYFQIMQENKNISEIDFKEILKELYKFDNHKKIQFSFVSKMQNLINPKFGIYDSAIKKAFGFPNISNSKYLERIDSYLEQYKLINETYNKILKEKALDDIIQKFGKEFDIYDKVKILDFIFWTAGKISNDKN